MKSNEIMQHVTSALVPAGQSDTNTKFFGQYISPPIGVSESGYIGIIYAEPVGKPSVWTGQSYKKSSISLHINDIVDYDFSTDEQTSSGTGAALLGGALFGTAGAVIGASTGGKTKITKIDLILKVNDFNNPTITIPLYRVIGSQIMDQIIYGSGIGSKIFSARRASINDVINEITELTNTLDMLRSRFAAKQTEIPQAASSDADELLKFKNLLDSGVITQEEFDAKKRQILGL